MKKTVIFAFRGDPMCFIHVLLNALDLEERGLGGRIVMEGEATRLLQELREPEHFLHGLYESVKKKGLIEGVCKACSTKMGTMEIAKEEGFPLLDSMKGHPSIGAFMLEGYEVLIM